LSKSLVATSEEVYLPMQSVSATEALSSARAGRLLLGRSLRKLSLDGKGSLVETLLLSLEASEFLRVIEIAMGAAASAFSTGRGIL
jgi:hypothetical protein